MHILQSALAAGGRRSAFHTRLALVVMLLMLPAQARASAEEPDDPEAPTRPLDYKSVLTGYDHIEVLTKPEDWRAANDLAEELGGVKGQILPEGMKPRRKSP